MERSEHDTTRAVSRKAADRSHAQERPYLLGIAGEHKGGFFLLEGLRELVIGRTEDCEVSLALDDLVSRRHARIEIDDAGRVWLADLESTNGTLVNGREVGRPILLRRGDRIFLGDATIFKLDYLSDEELARWLSTSVDALTECYNRAFFDARLAELFDLAKSRDRLLTVVMIDVDHFKNVNDEHTHQAGDFALQQVSAAMKDTLAREDPDAAACRYGGEEFVVIAPGCGPDRAKDLAEALRAQVEATRFEFEGEPLGVTISLGTATLGEQRYETAEALVRAADVNLLRAKREGRNRVVSG